MWKLHKWFLPVFLLFHFDICKISLYLWGTREAKSQPKIIKNLKKVKVCENWTKDFHCHATSLLIDFRVGFYHFFLFNRIKSKRDSLLLWFKSSCMSLNWLKRKRPSSKDTFFIHYDMISVCGVFWNINSLGDNIIRRWLMISLVILIDKGTDFIH